MRRYRNLLLGGPTVLLILLIATQALGATQPSPTPSPINIAINGKACLCNLPVIIADQVGFFRSEGIDVVIKDVGTDIGVHEAFLTQSAEIASGPLVHALSFGHHNTDQQASAPTVFVTTAQSVGLVLLTQAPESSHIIDVTDLQGAKVGVTSSPAMAATLLDRLLQTQVPDGAIDTVDIIRFVDEASAIQAMLTMEVDALIVPDPTATYLVRAYAAQILRDFRVHANLYEDDLSDGGNDKLQVDAVGHDLASVLSSIVLYADPEWVSQHESEVISIATALVKANRWLRDRPIDEILPWIPSNVYRDHTGEQFDQELLIEALEATIPSFSTSGTIEFDPDEDFDDVIGQNVTQAFVQDISPLPKQPLRVFLATNGLSLMELLAPDEAAFWQASFETLPGVFVVDDPLKADVLINVLITQTDQHVVFSAQMSMTEQLADGRMPLLITTTAPLEDHDAPTDWVTTLPHALLTWLRHGAVAWWQLLP